MARTKVREEMGMRICMALRYRPAAPPTMLGRLRNWYNRRAWWWRGL